MSDLKASCLLGLAHIAFQDRLSRQGRVGGCVSQHSWHFPGWRVSELILKPQELFFIRALIYILYYVDIVLTLSEIFMAFSYAH